MPLVVVGRPPGLGTCLVCVVGRDSRSCGVGSWTVGSRVGAVRVPVNTRSWVREMDGSERARARARRAGHSLSVSLRLGLWSPASRYS